MTQGGDDEATAAPVPVTAPSASASARVADGGSLEPQPVVVEEPPAVVLPWSSVRLGAEPATTRIHGSNDSRPIVHEGGATLDSVAVVRVTSPRCGHLMTIDLASVIARGTGRLAFTAAAPAALIDDVARAFRLQGRDFDGRLVLSGSHALPPSFAVLPCDGCSQLHLAVASYGEVQPDRFQLVFEGLAPLDRVSATTGELAVVRLDVTGEQPAVALEPEQGGSFPGARRRVGRGRVSPPLAVPPSIPWPAAANTAGGFDPHDVGPDPTGAGPPRRHPLPPLPPRLDGAPRWTLVATVLAGIAGLAVLVALHLWTWAAWSRTRDLANTGTFTSAIVLASDESHGPDRDDQYSLTYRYVVVVAQGSGPTGDEAGATTTTETGQSDVDHRTFARAQTSRRVDVRYDPQETGRSAIARDDSARPQFVVVGLADVALLAGAVVVARRARRPHPI